MVSIFVVVASLLGLVWLRVTGTWVTFLIYPNKQVPVWYVSQTTTWCGGDVQISLILLVANESQIHFPKAGGHCGL